MGLTKIDKSYGSENIGAGPKLAKILYVEDEDSNWNVTELHLRYKYELFRAKNSKETFEILSKQKIELILLDIQLAGSEFDGIEICKILKRYPFQEIPPAAKDLDYRKTPIVFVTAYAERHTKEALLKAGAEDVITKPVDFTRMKLVSARLIVRDLK